MAVVLFVGSSMSMSRNMENNTDCQNATFEIINSALDYGYSVEVATCVGNSFYANCTGWLHNIYECFD